MGLDFSYELWVPQESLYDFFTRIAQINVAGDLNSLIWPDGRRLAAASDAQRKAESTQIDMVPFDSSLDEGFCLAFRFEADEELRRYDLDEAQEYERQQRSQSGQAEQSRRSYLREAFGFLKRGFRSPEPAPHYYLREDGRYSIGCIWTRVDLEAERFDWLDDEPILVSVAFTAATTNMSQLFVFSLSIRRFFIDLARESGAVSCVLDREMDTVELLFLDGHEVTPTTWPDAHSHPREWRNLSEPTESQRKARFCSDLSDEPSHHELMEVALLTKDADSGVRAQAYKALSCGDVDTVLPIIEAGLSDENWRVRAVVAYLLGQLHLSLEYERAPQVAAPQVAAPLLRALRDPHPEVRTVAAGALRYFDDAHVFEAQLETFENTPLIPENLGLIKQTLRGLRINKAAWNASETVEKRLQEADFPFPNEAKRAVGILRTRRSKP